MKRFQSKMCYVYVPAHSLEIERYMKKKLMGDKWAVVIAPTSITGKSIFFLCHVQVFEK